MTLPRRAAGLARTPAPTPPRAPPRAPRHQRGAQAHENHKHPMVGDLPARRSALVLLALSGLLVACSSTDRSHGPSVATSGAAPAVSTADSPASGPSPAFTQRIEGTTVTIEMVQTAPASGETAALWMSRTEIPWDLYNVYVYSLDVAVAGEEADGITRPSKPYVPPDRGFGTNGYPAIGMTHHAAASFCQWLSARTGRTYRLPTEAEWEAACAAGQTEDPDRVAWHAGNAGGTTHPLASKEANALGLYDMLGNVAEWTDGRDGRPVARGGSYLDAPATLTCDTRQHQTPAWNTSDPQIPKSRWWLADCSFVGFRIVCEGPPPAAERD